jgi:hypothetical protein
MVRGLGRAVTEFHKLGKTIEEVERDIAGSQREEGWTERVRSKVKRQLQRKVKERISHNNKQAAVARIRHKVERWKLEQTGGLEMLPGRVAGRIFQRLHELKNLVTTRVVAAVFSTLWNRWCTERRFSRMGGCLLGCGGEAEDSIEHYVHCRTIHSVATRVLRLNFEGREAKGWFLLANKELADESVLTCMGVLIYAAYRTFNKMRVVGARGKTFAEDLMEQYIREAVKDHGKSSKVVNGRWVEVKGCKRARRG